MYLYLDIETIHAQSPEVRARIAETVKPPAQMKKAETIAQWEAEQKPAAVEEAVAKTALNGAYGHICCIGWAFDHGHIFSRYTDEIEWEAETLSSFFEDASKTIGNRMPTIVGHNVSGFDIRFIWQRCIALGIRAPVWLPRDPKPWGNDVFDTMTAWAGSRDTISMDNLCAALGLPGKGEIDGSMVGKLFAEGRHEEIAEYCRADVERVRQIHKRMMIAYGQEGCVMATADDIKMLFAEFPKEAISWRAQTVTKDGSKAMALAYIDARDVMDRLDSVIGADGWQDRYEFSGPRTICYLSIKIDGEWVTKSDGAGDTAVEAEKGAISDAFKRAAVKWGIGRYLYELDAPWVPCDTYEDRNGNKKWSGWKGDPWDHVRKPNAAKPSAASQKNSLTQIDNDLLDCKSLVAVDNCAANWKDVAVKENWSVDYKQMAAAKFAAKREQLSSAPENQIAKEMGGRIVNEHVKDQAA